MMIFPRAEWEALKASKLQRREEVDFVEENRPAKLQHDIVAYRDLAGRHAGWCCQRCRSSTRKPQALCKMEGVLLKGRKVERVGNSSKEAVLDGPGAPSYEGRGAYLVPQVWQVHRKRP